MKKLLSNLTSLLKPKPAVEIPPPVIDVEDNDDFGSVVDNNYGFLTTRDKECFDLNEKIFFSTKIDLNRHNNNAFEKKFYSLLFDKDLINIKLIIAAKQDEIKDAKHDYDKELAETIHQQAQEIYERQKAKFLLYAMENFKTESILMIKSMKAKRIIANSIEDIDLYFKTEWQSRKEKSYPAIVGKIALVEVAIMEEFKKLKIVPDTPPADDFLSEINGTSSKGKTTISF